MHSDDKINLLLVDDQPAKLLSYEVILNDIGANLHKAASAKEALELLLKNEFAVVLIDVCMPDLDGFELAAMIREHPRFQDVAIIFISAVLLNDTDRLRGYEMGAVDYVPVPVIPEVLRAKIKVFADLYRKTRQLAQFNLELEKRVADRTAELEASNNRLLESERRRSVALAAGQMGSWDWNVVTGQCVWDPGQYRIFGLEPDHFVPNFESIRKLIDSEDIPALKELTQNIGDNRTFQTEVRILRASGEWRSCLCAGALTRDAAGHVTNISGVTIDITERKQAEERQLLLAREVDHRARNALAVVQAIVRLTRAPTAANYVTAVEGRIRALSQAHTLLSQSRWEGADIARLVDEELAPYSIAGNQRVTIVGPAVLLAPDKAQVLALALHELATNSVKYGALSSAEGKLDVNWRSEGGLVTLCWQESGGPPVRAPTQQGFGTKIINTTIKHQIGGDVVMDWRPQGLNCTISIPSNARKPESITSQQRTKGLVQLESGIRKRVMLVEDEALVGMMVRDMLLDLGLFVVGPFCSVAEAHSALETQQYDCAILDLNLRGDTVYSVAELLEARGTPFIFVTGYGPESIDRRYAHIPVMQKPVARDMLEVIVRNQLGLEAKSGSSGNGRAASTV